MTTTPGAQYPQAWWEGEEAINYLRLCNIHPLMVWSQHNWDYWSQGGKVTDLQLQGWQEKGIFGAYFPDNKRWRRVWRWLMSLPTGTPIWDFTHPDGAPWASPLVFEHSTDSSGTSSTDDWLKDDEEISSIGLSIQVSASQSSQLRAAKQTSVLVNDAERIDTSTKMPLTSQLDPMNQALAVSHEVHPQRWFKKDAGSHFESITAEGETKRTQRHDSEK